MFLPWQLETKTIHFNICKLNINNSTRFTLTYLLRLDLLLHCDYVTSVDQETLINFLGVVKRLQWQKRRRGEKKAWCLYLRYKHPAFLGVVKKSVVFVSYP